MWEIASAIVLAWLIITFGPLLLAVACIALAVVLLPVVNLLELLFRSAPPQPTQRALDREPAPGAPAAPSALPTNPPIRRATLDVAASSPNPQTAASSPEPAARASRQTAEGRQAEPDRSPTVHRPAATPAKQTHPTPSGLLPASSATASTTSTGKTSLPAPQKQDALAHPHTVEIPPDAPPTDLRQQNSRPAHALPELETRILTALFDAPGLFVSEEATTFAELLADPDLQSIFRHAASMVEIAGSIDAPELLQELADNPAREWLVTSLSSDRALEPEAARSMLADGVRRLRLREKERQRLTLKREIQVALRAGNLELARELTLRRDDLGSRG